MRDPANPQQRARLRLSYVVMTNRFTRLTRGPLSTDEAESHSLRHRPHLFHSSGARDG
jgi:hypothetical protein